MHQRPQPDGETGAALATVLVMVAVMSMVAIGVLDAARFSIQRTENQGQMDQARWYLLGAEAYATSRIDQALTLAQSDMASLTGWVGRTITLPLDNGAMQVTVSDGANCFNLNSLVSQEEAGPTIASEAGQARFARLLSVVGIQSSRPLAAAAADWIDADNVPALGGAEDQAYGGSAAAYLPPNQLMGDVSELRSVNGFDAGVVGRLSRLACVRPTTAPNAISINALRPEQAPLLSAVFGPGLPLAGAEAVIRSRPTDGWSSLEAFFADPRLSAIQLSDESRGMFTLVSRWYVIGVRVHYADTVETSVALVDTVSGHGRVVRRVFGASPTSSLL
jgi:general secretion pathway protein K